MISLLLSTINHLLLVTSKLVSRLFNGPQRRKFWKEFTLTAILSSLFSSSVKAFSILLSSSSILGRVDPSLTNFASRLLSVSSFIASLFFLLVKQDQGLIPGTDPGFFSGGGALLRNDFNLVSVFSFFRRILFTLESRRSSRGAGSVAPAPLP